MVGWLAAWEQDASTGPVRIRPPVVRWLLRSSEVAMSSPGYLNVGCGEAVEVADNIALMKETATTEWLE